MLLAGKCSYREGSQMRAAEAFLRQHRGEVALGGADRVAAFYCEPIQGSGGVLVPPPGWVKAMRELCRELLRNERVQRRPGFLVRDGDHVAGLVSR